MKTKLTLSVDKDLVQFAHQQAKSSGQSVSDAFSNYLRQRQKHASKTNTPSIEDMVGILKNAKIDDSKEGIRAAYAEKYLDRY